MRHLLLTAAIALVPIAVVSDARGGGYSNGHGSRSCAFIPSSALVGQSFTVHAVGLPTQGEVDLVVTSYEATTSIHGPLAVNPDGAWSGTFSAPNDGCRISTSLAR